MNEEIELDDNLFCGVVEYYDYFKELELIDEPM